jgi:hypothetical protein
MTLIELNARWKQKTLQFKTQMKIKLKKSIQNVLNLTCAPGLGKSRLPFSFKAASNACGISPARRYRGELRRRRQKESKCEKEGKRRFFCLRRTLFTASEDSEEGFARTRRMCDVCACRTCQKQRNTLYEDIDWWRKLRLENVKFTFE